jgi:hypothetical protein
MDALIYSSSNVSIPTENLHSYGLFSIMSNSPDPAHIDQYLNTILSRTSIKRVCCMNKGKADSSVSSYPVTIRIPTPENYDYGNNPNADMWKKYGYIEKTINVTPEICKLVDPSYNYNSTTCDDFMHLYCKNAKYEFMKGLDGSAYSNSDFSKYRPECGCFGNKPDYISDSNVGGGVQPSCYLDECDITNTKTYIPIASRPPCTANFCSSLINFKDAQIGGKFDMSSKVVQNCGDYVKKGVKKEDDGGSDTPKPKSDTLEPKADTQQPKSDTLKPNADTQQPKSEPNADMLKPNPDKSISGTTIAIIVIAAIMLLLCLIVGIYMLNK